MFNACSDELLLHSNSEGQDQAAIPHTHLDHLWIARLFMYSIVYVNLKQTKVLIRANDDKVLRYRCNILLIAK